MKERMTEAQEPSAFSKDQALQLIQDGRADDIIENIEKFTGLDKEVALKLIEAGKGKFVAHELIKFTSLDEGVIFKLIEAGSGGSLAYMFAYHAEDFPDLDQKKFVIKLIEAGRLACAEVVHHLNKFTCLDEEVALKLIGVGGGGSVAYHLNKFTNINYEAIASKLIEIGEGKSVASNFDLFIGLDQKKFASKLIEAGEGASVGQHIEKFPDLDKREITLKLIEAGSALIVSRNLDKFAGLDEEVIFKLIEAGGAEGVAAQIKEFPNLSHEKIALKLIEIGKGESVGLYLNRFTQLDQKKIALKLIEIGKGESVVLHFNKFSKLEQKEIALKLIEAGGSESIATHLDRLTNLDKEIAFKLIEARQGRSVVANMEKFIGLNQKEIVLKLIEVEDAAAIVDSLDKFTDLDKEVALGLIKGGNSKLVARKSDKFTGLDKEVALKLIEAEAFDNVSGNLYKFTGLDKEVALKLIEAGEGGEIPYELNEFTGIDHEEIALKLIEMGQGDVVAHTLGEFTGDIFRKAENSHKEEMLTPEEYLFLHLKEDNSVDKDDTSREEHYVHVIDCLSSKEAIGLGWDDEQNITGPFRAGAEIFGNERMFRYLNRPGLSRHDGLHAFRAIISLYENSGASPNLFYDKILNQVARDDVRYESGTAHHELNQIAFSFDPNFESIIEKTKKYSGIKYLQQLAEHLSSPEAVFASWKNLRRYNDLVAFLGKTEILEPLSKEKNEKLRGYIETLAFHPDGNVDIQKVMEFWNDPKAFLGLPDDHTPDEVHNRKKPSNLAEIPNLDLTPEDLRDSLVDGSLDRLQTFSPMKGEYTVGYSLREEARRAIGESKNKIPGIALQPKKLFSELAKLLNSQEITVQQFLAGEGDISPALEAGVNEILARSDIGIPEKVRTKFPMYRLKMQINAKSDPHGVLAGNDTACCMPFGSGKNNVYTWNPACAHATLSIERRKGVRTIAQSVLTKDRNIGKNVAAVVRELDRDGNERLQEIISEDILRQAPAVLACDNVEVGPNYRDGDYPEVIETVYRDFLREYLERHGVSQKFTTDHAVIGLGYSDSLTHLPRIENTTIPEAPVGYSDKTHNECYELKFADTTGGRFVVRKRNITDINESSDVVPEKAARKEISELTFEDVMPVSYIEGKAYAGNDSLMEYLWKIENTLIAKDINNSAKERPNLSFKYESEGKMRGYLLAYEGKLEKDGYDGPGAEGESIIYIGDLAVAEPGSVGGARASSSLIDAFVDRYHDAYLSRGNFIPIAAHARERTSYRLIERKLNALEKKIGISFELEEGDAYEIGNDIMHPIIIRPKGN